MMMKYPFSFTTYNRRNIGFTSYKTDKTHKTPIFIPFTPLLETSKKMLYKNSIPYVEYITKMYNKKKYVSSSISKSLKIAVLSVLCVLLILHMEQSYILRSIYS